MLTTCSKIFRPKSCIIQINVLLLCQLNDWTGFFTSPFAIFAAVNTPNETPRKAEEANDLQAKIDILEAEKLKLEAELKSREEMMSNLLSFIQASK